jgi:hypothetical protein
VTRAKAARTKLRSGLTPDHELLSNDSRGEE